MVAYGLARYAGTISEIVMDEPIAYITAAKVLSDVESTSAAVLSPSVPRSLFGIQYEPPYAAIGGCSFWH